MNTNQLYKQLSIIYYGILIGVIGFLLVYYFFFKDIDFSQQFSDNVTVKFQMAGILVLLIAIPLGLKYYSIQVKKIRDIKNEEEKIKKYTNLFIVRLAAIEFPLLLNLMMFIITKNTSMMYCVGIAFLALLFCKPNKIKMLEELNVE